MIWVRMVTSSLKIGLFQPDIFAIDGPCYAEETRKPLVEILKPKHSLRNPRKELEPTPEHIQQTNNDIYRYVRKDTRYVMDTVRDRYRYYCIKLKKIETAIQH
jgi:hypothetical protein